MAAFRGDVTGSFCARWNERSTKEKAGDGHAEVLIAEHRASVQKLGEHSLRCERDARESAEAMESLVSPDHSSASVPRTCPVFSRLSVAVYPSMTRLAQRY